MSVLTQRRHIMSEDNLSFIVHEMLEQCLTYSYLMFLYQRNRMSENLFDVLDAFFLTEDTHVARDAFHAITPNTADKVHDWHRVDRYIS